jgi:hypothetical protein
VVSNLAAEIKNCRDRAAEADRAAKLGRTPSHRQDALAIARGWRKLAASYERLEKLLNP